MFRLIAAFSFLLISARVSFPGPDKEKEAEFFAGVTLLQQKTDLKPGEKAAKFRELAVLTGISAAEAKTVLERYRERPEEWKKIDSIMMKLLNDVNREFRKKDSMQTAAKDAGKKADSTRQTLNTGKIIAAFKGKGLTRRSREIGKQ
jgi:hypothetical protein